MEAAFWSWTQGTPAAHIYGVYTSQHSCRTSIYHSREQLHSLQQTMYFDETIYPHLPQPLLDRILRIRALVNHAADDLTAALDHIEAIGQFSPSQLKGKGKGKSTDTSDLTDDPTTGIPQSELIHPYTPPQAMAQPYTTPPPITTNTTPQEQPPPITPQTAMTPDFPHTKATAPPPRPTYTCICAQPTAASHPHVQLTSFQPTRHHTHPHSNVTPLKSTTSTSTSASHFRDMPH